MINLRRMTTNRINLWSSPRNISTAIMYSFAQREDTAVVDEPLYAHYLTHQTTAAEHPGKADVLTSQENDGNLVTEEMLHRDYAAETVVFKQMTHHLIEIDQAFLKGMKNVLLIRSPRAILNSFSKVVEEVTAEDIGLPQQHQLFRRLKQGQKLTAVVDARLLLMNPERVLQQLCDRLGLTFTKAMLSWPAGPRPEDGTWAAHWYTNVHKSTGFQPWQESTINLPPHLETIAETCQPLYEEMLAEALR
ncbi:sulfotransferase-like domain-containing protein [Neolewinella persica]|uniref:sulfotransferase-like domain-containing protein n=1 Tax=Neolewinella persica TaxID=70998 RepID=UPI001FDEF5C7|nr:hypothetical protein [Neolewinella persica]